MTSELTEMLRKDFYDRLTNLYRLSDDEIKAAGFGFLIPEPTEPSEPDIETLEEFTFCYEESWRGLFTIPAHNREEAQDLFEKQLDSGDIDTLDRLEKCDSTWYLLN